MDEIKRKLRVIQLNVVAFFKWIIIAAITGMVGGGIGSIFHLSVEFATNTRIQYPWIIYLLPQSPYPSLLSLNSFSA